MRFQAEHMLVHCIIPDKLKGQQARKYYNFAAAFEMNRLYHDGVDGVRVVMYGTSLDSPGRREILSMQLVSAYYCCPHCLHAWQPGPCRKTVYGGYRRFLSADHPMRAKTFHFRGYKYEFRDVERRLVPIKRDDFIVDMMAGRARVGRPFMGHKGDSFLLQWHCAGWDCNMPEPMHDIKTFAECVVKGLVGSHSGGGMFSGWSKDSRHRRECEAFGIFEAFVNGADPPWRLTRSQVLLMDKRVRSMWWAHYTDKLCHHGLSFWLQTDRMWKATHKIFCLMVLLPTCLRGFVRATHLALLVIVDALTKLAGQTVSIFEASELGVDPGLVIDKRSIRAAGKQLVFGLVLLEGSFPASHLNPNGHHLVHYGTETARIGLLRWVAMPAFERANKRLKGLVRSNRHPDASLANTVHMDMATRIDELDNNTVKSFPKPLNFRLSSRTNGVQYIPTRRERFCMSLIGVTCFQRVRSFPTAWVQGVHFSCGEWGMRTCGSVFTTVYCEHSVFGILDRFLQAEGKMYASVTWLSKPVYPYAPIKLVARVQKIPEGDQPLIRCVIDCDRIDPTSIHVMPDEDGVHFFMMRAKGFNR